MFGKFAERASFTGYEPKQFDDMTSCNLRQNSGSAMISRSSSSCSVTELAVTTIPRTDSLDQAQRDRLRRRDHGHPFSPRKTEWYQKKNKSSGTFGDVTSKGHENLTRNYWFNNSARKRKMEHDTTAEGRLQPNSDARARYSSRAGEEIWRYHDASGALVNYFEEPFAKSWFGWSPQTRNFDYEAIESERYQLQSQESFVLHGARGRGYQHQQKVIEMQHFGDASLKNQEKWWFCRKKQWRCEKTWTSRASFEVHGRQGEILTIRRGPSTKGRNRLVKFPSVWNSGIAGNCECWCTTQMLGQTLTSILNRNHVSSETLYISQVALFVNRLFFKLHISKRCKSETLVGSLYQLFSGDTGCHASRESSCVASTAASRAAAFQAAANPPKLMDFFTNQRSLLGEVPRGATDSQPIPPIPRSFVNVILPLPLEAPSLSTLEPRRMWPYDVLPTRATFNCWQLNWAVQKFVPCFAVHLMQSWIRGIWGTTRKHLDAKVAIWWRSWRTRISRRQSNWKSRTPKKTIDFFEGDCMPTGPSNVFVSWVRTHLSGILWPYEHPSRRR